MKLDYLSPAEPGKSEQEKLFFSLSYIFQEEEQRQLLLSYLFQNRLKI